MIVGELACGNLKNRKEILSLLQELPEAEIVDHMEVLHFIEEHQTMGQGLGFIDNHLLASAVLTGVRFWTFDKRLKKVAAVLNVDL